MSPASMLFSGNFVVITAVGDLYDEITHVTLTSSALSAFQASVCF